MRRYNVSKENFEHNGIKFEFDYSHDEFSDIVVFVSKGNLVGELYLYLDKEKLTKKDYKNLIKGFKERVIKGEIKI